MLGLHRPLARGLEPVDRGQHIFDHVQGCAKLMGGLVQVASQIPGIVDHVDEMIGYEQSLRAIENKLNLRPQKIPQRYRPALS